MTEQQLRADAMSPGTAAAREERNIIETPSRDSHARVSGRTLFTLIYLVAIVVLVLDIVTKQIVYRTLPLGGPSIEVLGSFLRWTYIHNPGAAFGLFTANRYFFIGVSLLSTIVILALVHGSRYRDRWTLFAFGLILGGAIGNLLDRLWLGVVIDFIDVGIGSHRWPFFNIADSGISVGVVLLALRFLREPKAKPADHLPSPDAERNDRPSLGDSRGRSSVVETNAQSTVERNDRPSLGDSRGRSSIVETNAQSTVEADHRPSIAQSHVETSMAGPSARSYLAGEARLDDRPARSPEP